MNPISAETTPLLAFPSPASHAESLRMESSVTAIHLHAMAEMELTAFVAAVALDAGAKAAERAGELWIEALEAMPLALGGAPRDWLRVTIAAASLLAGELARTAAPFDARVAQQGHLPIPQAC